jgi:aminoglycoside phosphotransferase (APT) family kinase protein
VAMQGGWSRASAHLKLDAAALERLLKPAFGDHAVTAFTPLSGGLANTNYRVMLSGHAEPVVVRIFTREPAACAKETAITRLVEREVPVSRLLYAACDAEPPYAVAAWIEGGKLEEVLRAGGAADAHAAGHAAGATLAAIHRHCFAEAGFFGPDLTVATPLGPIRTACEGYVAACLGEDRVRERLGVPLASRLAEVVREYAPLLATLPAPSVLLHGDYKPQNLLLRRDEAGDWRTAAVLDWEFAFAGPSLFDVGQLVRYRATLPPEYTAGVAAGYTAAGGALPEEWLRLTRLLDLMNLLGFLDRPEANDAMVREVRGLVERTVADVGSEA